MEDENQIRVLMSISHLQGCSTYWPEYEWFFSTFHDSFNFLVCLLFFLVSNIIAVKEKKKTCLYSMEMNMWHLNILKDTMDIFLSVKDTSIERAFPVFNKSIENDVFMFSYCFN